MTIAPLSKTLQTLSQNDFKPPSAASLCTASEAASAAAFILGCYRKGDAADPETYATAIAAVLSRYPAQIVRKAADPRTGIACRHKFLPSVAEVRDFCEAEMEPIYREEARQGQQEAIEAFRRADPDVDRSNRPTFEELQAKCGGKNWGFAEVDMKPRKAGPTLEELKLQGTSNLHVSPQLRARFASAKAERDAE